MTRVIPTIWDRLQAKAIINDAADVHTCWTWTGALSLKRRSKRPVVWYQGKVVSVARLVCELTHGPAPTPDHEAGHTCPNGENALCISPHHLQWMTRVENEQHKRRYREAIPDDIPLPSLAAGLRYLPAWADRRSRRRADDEPLPERGY